MKVLLIVAMSSELQGFLDVLETMEQKNLTYKAKSE